MNDFPTTPVSVGKWGRNISDAMRRTNPAGMPGVTQLPGGVSQNNRTNLPPRTSFRPPKFWVYGVGENIKITGGTFIQPTIENYLAILDSDAITPANGDKVWLERTGANAWAFNHGASWPTDKLYFELFGSVTVTGGKVSLDEANRIWHGGDIPFPEVFPVTVTGTGDPPTYTVKDLQGVQILSGATPTNYRDEELSYVAGTVGHAKFDGDGALTFFVEDEYAAHETKCVAIVTGASGTDSDGNPCYIIQPTQYSLTKLKSPASCP